MRILRHIVYLYSNQRSFVKTNPLSVGKRFKQISSNEQKGLPFRIPPGGKESNEIHDNNHHSNNGVESGEMIVEGWKEKHASESEAVVKAERYIHKDGTKELQKLSVKHFNKS